MKHVNNFENFLNESKGIARVIYSPLEKFFKEHGKDASYEKAKKAIGTEVEGWDLSHDDYKEAEKKFSKDI
jgi:hypothetical protein